LRRIDRSTVVVSCFDRTIETAIFPAAAVAAEESRGTRAWWFRAGELSRWDVTETLAAKLYRDANRDEKNPQKLPVHQNLAS
jgi:hypothetical protein